MKFGITQTLPKEPIPTPLLGADENTCTMEYRVALSRILQIRRHEKALCLLHIFKSPLKECICKRIVSSIPFRLFYVSDKGSMGALMTKSAVQM